MRSGKFLFFASLLALACVIALVAGCSDDKTATSASVNNDDVQYQEVKAEVNQFIDSSITQFTSSLEMIIASEKQEQTDTIINQAYSPFVPDSITENGGWHVVYSDGLIAGYNTTLVDSIQFRRHGIAQPDAYQATEMLVRHLLSYADPDTTGDYRNSEVHSNLLFSALNTQTAVVNGTRSNTVETKEVSGSTVVKRTYDVQMQLSGVSVPKAYDNWSRGCPSSGTIEGTVVYSVQRGANVPVQTTWNFSITLEDGGMTATVTAGLYQQSYSASICEL